MSKKSEVLEWIAAENKRLRDKNDGESLYYYFIEGNRVRYMDYDRALGSWTFSKFWDEFIRPRTPNEIEEIIAEKREWKKREEEWERQETEKKLKKQRETELEFERLTGTKPSEAVYLQELPDDGKMYFETEKGFVEVK